ncbi:hypothetical protein C3941_11720 [Kaistia algarum]|uniref:LysE family translocator n=1 Tax=Kaistia algarum TaxID=2083279 RepID=UPI000CE79C0B|nr:LysE family transporter [Kaistia algarum]MCX5515014.1 LysE family transporter [Kaistia algarum]PPE79756.1 hypothetical protein C3941_11720 [Kaistia algarum]
MNDPLAFALAVLALLAVPGPTNTLLAASGATAGFRRSLRLLPAELGGYWVAIGVLLLVIGLLAAAHPFVPILSKLVASLYLVYSAISLWRDAGRGMMEGAGPITFARVFTTTLLNPKALIFAFAIFPRGDIATLLPFAGLFSVLVVIVAQGWIVLGNAIARHAAGLVTPARIARAAALALAVFALWIGGSALAAALS